MSVDQVPAIAELLKRVPPPARTLMATDLVAGGVRFAPEERAVSELVRLRQIDKVGGLLKKLPPHARVLMATELVGAGCVIDVPAPDADSAPLHTKVGVRALGPVGDSPMRAALRLANPGLFERIDAAERARAEGDHSAAEALIAELRPRALAGFEELRSQGAALKPGDFEQAEKAAQ
jgi:hypothetical protein